MCIFNIAIKLLFVRSGGFADTRDLFRGGFVMIKRLQRLKSKRGFTLIEAIVVIAIISIVIVASISSANNTRDTIKEANSTAADFYSAIQTELVKLQMFDAPLTLTLTKVYSESRDEVKTNHDYGGMMYFSAAGGNYPIDTYNNPDTINGTLPVTDANLYLEFRVFAGKIQYCDWDYTMQKLVEKTGKPSTTSELSAVIQNDMQGQVSLQDGYYYAYASYTAPVATPTRQPNMFDYKANSIKVQWVLYCQQEFKTADYSTPFKLANVTGRGYICGVCISSTAYGTAVGTPYLGHAGSKIEDYCA